MPKVSCIFLTRDCSNRCRFPLHSHSLVSTNIIFLPSGVVFSFRKTIFTKFPDSGSRGCNRTAILRSETIITIIGVSFSLLARVAFHPLLSTDEGCVQNGVHHGSETEWIEENDPCRIFSCKAGVITESRLHCYTPCSNPIPAAAGQCCPMCAGK